MDSFRIYSKGTKTTLMLEDYKEEQNNGIRRRTDKHQHQDSKLLADWW